MIYVVGMAPLMMHHAYTNYGGGGSNMQQIQGPSQQLHLQQHPLQQHWNNHKRSKYHYQIKSEKLKRERKKERNIKFRTAKQSVCPSNHLT